MNAKPTAARTGLRYQAALRMLFRAARRQRYGVSLGRDAFTPDDRRKLRNARKAERRAS